MRLGGVSDIFRHRNERINIDSTYVCLVAKVNVETVADLKKALKEVGYSNKAVTEIIKWYTKGPPPGLS